MADDSKKKLSLFAETKFRLDESKLSKIKEAIISPNWEWPSKTLPNYLMKQSVIDSVVDDPMLREFIDHYKCFSLIMKVPPYSYVPWHVDIMHTRKCCLNLPLDTYESETFFMDGHLSNFEDSSSNKTIRVPYDNCAFYMINGGNKYHCVFNYSNKTRYVLSLTSPDIEYSKTYDYLDSRNLIERCW